jgi:hypothetical protein
MFLSGGNPSLLKNSVRRSLFTPDRDARAQAAYEEKNIKFLKAIMLETILILKMDSRFHGNDKP